MDIDSTLAPARPHTPLDPRSTRSRATRSRATRSRTARAIGIALLSCAVAGPILPAPALALTNPVLAQAQDQPPLDGLDQTIGADQPVAVGPAVLDDGHVDIGPRFVDGEWTLMVHDDSVVPSVWRRLDDAVIHVTDHARQPVPDDPTYDFLGVAPGTEVHVVPQVQQPGVVWVGWNTQDPEVLARADRGATLSLLGVQGPGALTMYLQAGNLTEPDVLWHTPVTEPQPIWVEVNTHTHANWVFTEPGVHLVRVEVAAELIDGRTVSDIATLRFAVGDATGIDEARTAAFTDPVAPVADTEGDDAAGLTGEDGGSTVPVVAIVAVGAVVLILGVGAAAVRGGSAKRRAERERAAAHPDAPGSPR